MLIAVAIPAYLVLQVAALATLSGNWRRAAWVPVFAMVPLVGYTILALIAQSNLWPLLLILLTPFALLYLVILFAVRIIVHVVT